ncbi:Casparian strip membrane protein domain - like 10 [Theobroma cacao]|nr:Casparian strip membrane protein domain - like 10 [Theobroma cacao]
MSNPDEPTKNNHEVSPAPPTATDVENPTQGVESGVSAITSRWRREDLLKRGSLVARGLTLLFSFLSFIIMASNKHGDEEDGEDFNKYQEYRYLLAIAILSFLYTGGQVGRHVIWTGKQIFERRVCAMVDFLGDQVQYQSTWHVCFDKLQSLTQSTDAFAALPTEQAANIQQWGGIFVAQA